MKRLFSLFGKKTSDRKARDAATSEKIAASQRVLLAAATQTANVAQDVTSILKGQLDDSAKRFEATARIIPDALLLCDMKGKILWGNEVAERDFAQGLAGASVLELFDHAGAPVDNVKALWSHLEDADCWRPDTARPLRGKRADGALVWIEPKIERLDWHNKTSSMLILLQLRCICP